MQTRLIPYQTEVNTYGRIVELLGGGATQAQVARVLRVSPAYVSKAAKKAVREGLLSRVGKCPVLYTRTINHPTLPSAPTKPLMLPHRFGVRFLFRRKPKQLRGFKRTTVNNWDLFTKRAGDHTIVVYPSRAIVWLFNFTGATVQERVRRGVEMCRELALALQEDTGCLLCAGELITPVEWVIDDQPLSDYVRQALDLDAEAKAVAGARFKVDSSHPDKVEIDRDKATEAAEAMEWLITDGRPALLTSAEMLQQVTRQLGELASNQSDILTFLQLNRGKPSP